MEVSVTYPYLAVLKTLPSAFNKYSTFVSQAHDGPGDFFGVGSCELDPHVFEA